MSAAGFSLRSAGRCGSLLLALAALLALGGPPPAVGAAAATVTDLRVQDLWLGPKSLQIAWSYGAAATFEVARITGGVTTVLGQTTATEWTDSFDFALGTEYVYRVTPSGGNPAAISVVVAQVGAAENQTADSRTVDRRTEAVLADPVYLDHAFGGSVYRGGLFVGLSGDPARAGRSFLKFLPPGLPVGSNLWTASVNAYHTRSLASGTVRVGCQRVASGWSAETLRWTTAPALAPATPASTADVAYDTLNPVPRWYHWRVPDCAEIVSGTAFAVGLAAVDETVTGWAYFAKKEFDAALGPVLLYAYGAPLALCHLSLDPTTVYGGASTDPVRFPSTSTGTASLNGRAPAGGIEVALSSSDPLVAVVPPSVTIAEGSASGSFEVTTLPVTATTTVTISAAWNGVTRTALLTVKPLVSSGSSGGLLRSRPHARPPARRPPPRRPPSRRTPPRARRDGAPAAGVSGG